MKHLRIGRQLRCEPAESAAFRLISPCIKLFLQDFNDNDEILVHFVAERATHTPFRCVFSLKFDKYKEDVCNLRLGFAIAQKEVAVIPITADGLGREFVDFDFDKVFSAALLIFLVFSSLLYVAIKGEAYITTELMYVAMRFQKIENPAVLN